MKEDSLKTYDEINIIDWPMTVFGDQLEEDSKDGRVYNITVRNKINGNRLHGYLKFYYIKHAETAHLMPYDEDVLLALISLASDKYFTSQSMLFQSQNEILDRLGWSRGGRNYKKLESSLTRLAGMLIETDIFYNKLFNIYEHRKFHIVDRVSLRRRIFRKSRQIVKQGVRAVEIVWSDTVFMSLKSGNIRPLNYSLYLKIKEPGSKKLYRVLDKRFFKKHEISIPLEYLSINILGIHHSKSAKQKHTMINRYCKELIDVGYLGAYSLREEDGKKMCHFITTKWHSRDS